MIGRLTFIVALLAAPLAMAQEATPPPPPSAAQLATASAEADALIVRSGAPEFFTNVSSDGMAKVRHRASGLVCSFVPGAENNRLTVFDGGQVRRGDDVGCNADMGPVFLTYYATRYGPGYSAADSARDAAAAIHNRFPDARPYEGTFARVEPPEGVGALEYAAFVIGPADAPRYSHALTAKVGDWIFKQRLTGDGAGEAPMANLIMGGIFFNDVLRAAVAPSKP
jgi:hypothetical protein